MSYWESMENHVIYYPNDIDKQKTIENVLVQDDYIKPCIEDMTKPITNGDWLEFSTPDTDLTEGARQYEPDTNTILISIERDMENQEAAIAEIYDGERNKVTTYVSPKQQQLNYKFYTKKLKDPAMTFHQFIQLKVMIYNAQQTEHGKYYFFPAGLSREFWALCQDKQEEFNQEKMVKDNLKQSVFDNFHAAITGAKTSSELNKIRQEVYDNKVLYFEAYKGKKIDKKSLFSTIRDAKQHISV